MAEFADGISNDEAECFTWLDELDIGSDHLLEHETSSDEDLLWCPFGVDSHPIKVDDRL